MEEAVEKDEEDKKEHFWDFVYELRDVLHEDEDMLDEYVEEMKAKKLAQKDIEEEEDLSIPKHLDHIMTEFDTHGPVF